MGGVTVVIPHWNRHELLASVLADLRAQTYPIDEVLVVDNGSTDGSPELAQALGARVVRLPSNRGFAAAVNQGIDECRSELVAILNNDVSLSPEWLHRLVQPLDDPAISFTTGKLLNTNHKGYLDGTFDLLSRAGCAWRAGNARSDGAPWSTPRRIFSAPLTASLFRVELFRAVGKLDERYISYMEDVDLGLRCALNGRSGLYVPDAIAWHAGSATLGSRSPEVVRLIARNQVLLAAKHYPGKLVVRWFWAILVGQLLWGVVALRHRALLAFLRGKMAGLAFWIPMRRQSSTRADPLRLREVLEANERNIRELQRQTGFDLYWRIYFRLT
ncbi:MAG: glycosyltransferase family 2 protein [Bryobacteraceae bacterium]|nr:glycosyltransferase family 2 protein [Bryobacterales bacterium]MEB2364098.1 glycosyltransferase family 2 protein [Bryobacterales bacterium]NUN02968.1 glycosyltransferase family 2 protein [Bryobacteraceae bacterium]